ncbi:Nicotine blue oxidoreductase [Frondihabitans sp. 762G35]|uniref:nucleotidyltransferase family protein n=1 Tax=Frondihabitans sp. 762G35 TaxID=1446794 RepID=UPI000D20E9A2|nr:nucleotidyltransferase family protein [Frondihabitans sp. 762G35]ARC58477.1 Nicotine blue oxidoreductase [Frondihabitans sp. 762G35]
MTRLAGLVLAAGAGRRYGGPKALVRDAEGAPWLLLAHDLLAGAGCTDVTVVLGAEADRARHLVPAGAHTVVADDWDTGMAASLRAGLAAVASSGADAEAVLVTLVDLPGLPVAVARRVAERVTGPDALAQAVFGARPGHPALIGRDHWPALTASLAGDRGARAYLAAHGAAEVECGDLASGDDVDVAPPERRR